jgi:phosphate transport system protein
MGAQRHTDREYEGELSLLQERLLRMAGRVEEMIDFATRSVMTRDRELACRTIALDAQVNRDEVEIDELCLTILARRQPLASDLRFIASALKMVTDLERVGDLAVNISERAIALTEEPPLPPVAAVPRMTMLVRRAVQRAMDAFVRGDDELARNVIARDDEIDELYHQTLRALLEVMRQDASAIQRGIHLQAVVKFLERIGDHATNLAEEVVFLVQGKDIRHTGKRHVGRADRDLRR